MVLSQLRSLPTVTLAPFKLEYNNSIPRFTFCHFLTWQYSGSLRTWKTVKSFKVISDARVPWRNEFHGWVHPVTRLIAKLIYEWNRNPRPGRNIIWGYLDWLPISSFYVDSYLYPWVTVPPSKWGSLLWYFAAWDGWQGLRVRAVIYGWTFASMEKAPTFMDPIIPWSACNTSDYQKQSKYQTLRQHEISIY